MFVLTNFSLEESTMLRNSTQAYGLVSISLHWLSAIAVIGLFTLGLWMVELTYYSSWYKTAPDIHKSVGVLLLLATLFRLIWRVCTLQPAPEAGHKAWEKRAASIAHLGLYVLLLVIMFAGLLISTADGRGVMVFNWFEVPGFGELFENQADIAGLIHEYAAYSLIGLVLVHAAGALKHHVIDKDNTLKKMLGFNNHNS
jgi:cytochrome b561